MKEQSWIEEGWFFHNHAWHLLHEIIKQIPKDTKSLLDVGAGTGIAAAIIKAVYPDIKCTVCDIAEDYLKFWHQRDLYGFLTKNNELLRPDYFDDIVISSHVLEHLEDPAPLIDEMFRVAKRRVIIAIPDGDVHFYDHKIIFNRTSLREWIEKTLYGKKYNLKMFPVYHPHINNLMAVIDKI